MGFLYCVLLLTAGNGHGFVVSGLERFALPPPALQVGCVSCHVTAGRGSQVGSDAELCFSSIKDRAPKALDFSGRESFVWMVLALHVARRDCKMLRGVAFAGGFVLNVKWG